MVCIGEATSSKPSHLQDDMVVCI